jgi:hypothetical protein
MSWERRGNHLYYYKKTRRAGRIVCEYIGAGAHAEAVADAIRAERERRLAERLALRAARESEREAADAVESQVIKMFECIGYIYRAAMAAAGYHLHKREWRRRRMSAKERTELERQIGELWTKSAAGDPSVYDQIKRMFDAAPAALAKAYGGDMASLLEEKLISRVAGKDLLQREALSRKIAEVRAGLAGPEPTVIELLLAESAALCWFEAYEADLGFFLMEPAVGAEERDYYDRRRGRAHHRFLQAVKALAVVRQKMLPASSDSSRR